MTPPCRAMPFTVAPMACSRTPKWRLRPAKLHGTTDRTLRTVGRRGRTLEVAGTLQPGERRRVEIRRAADQLGQACGERLHHRLRRLARRERPWRRRGSREGPVSHPAGRLAGNRALQLCGVASGKALAVRLEPTVPLGLAALGRGRRASRKCADASGGIKNGRLDRPAEMLLRRAQLVGPSGEPCASIGVPACEGAPKPICVRMLDQRRTIGDLACGRERPVERIHVVAVADRGRRASRTHAKRAGTSSVNVSDGGAARARCGCRRRGRRACRAQVAGQRGGLCATPSIRSPSLART